MAENIKAIRFSNYEDLRFKNKYYGRQVYLSEDFCLRGMIMYLKKYWYVNY